VRSEFIAAKSKLRTNISSFAETTLKSISGSAILVISNHEWWFSSSDFYSFPARACSYSLTPSFFIAEKIGGFGLFHLKLFHGFRIKDSRLCEVGNVSSISVSKSGRSCGSNEKFQCILWLDLEVPLFV
jgi:hypothetical protein